jgi:hypothetical protein
MTVNQDHLLWSAKLPNGEVRSGTLEQLSEAFRSGHVSEATLVRSAGSEQWSRLVDVLRAVASGAAPHSVLAAQAPVSVRPVAAPAPAPVFTPAPVASAPLSPPLQSVPPTSNGISADPDAWHVRLPTGQVRSGTREQLEEAFRSGHLADATLVLPAGARSWVELGVLMRQGEAPPPAIAPSAAPPAVAPSAAPPPVAVAPVAPAAVAVPAPVVARAPSAAPAPPPASAAPAGDDVWQVRLPDGQVRSGTRQQLEEAFHAGHLDENTPVLAAGAPGWLPLREAASRYGTASSGDAAPGPAADEPAPVAAPSTPAMPAEAAEAPAESAERPVEQDQAEPAVERQWQVRLGETELRAAVAAGLLGDDVLVLAPGTDQWVKLGELRGSSAASLPA